MIELQADRWTSEQRLAIERRDGDLLLDAGAGSGKTSVLVERFVRSVLDDGVAVASILAITFTDKAAAELRERIRSRLRELGADEAARATEAAFISTIHGFCARVLRTHALSAGIDPAFDVLDEPEAQRLADAAFDGALEELAGDADGVELIASYTPGGLRGAILAIHAELRSRGDAEPKLPPLPRGPALADARERLRRAAAAAAEELGAAPSPSAKVLQALDRIGRCRKLLGTGTEPWPAELERFGLPGGNGAALSTPVCAAYTDALGRFRRACEHRRAQRTHASLQRLLQSFARRYAAHKRERAGLDFEDLELMARELLERDAELRERYRGRFERVMVDEMQDTNRVQLALIDLIAADNLFLVGDAQQSIYAFRHADVELFEERAARLELLGARARLQTNFRSRPEILAVINEAFAQQSALGESFRPLAPGRGTGESADGDAPGGGPLVELLVADKAGDWAVEGVAAPWRIAEARALAARVSELIADGAAPRDFVVLTRASTDLRSYERALEERGVPTYVIGGRGYWSHQQIVDVVAYLRALANPREEQELFTVLASPLVGISLDALVVVASAARDRGRDPWWLLREPDGAFAGLDRSDRERLQRFVEWFSAERAGAARLDVEELIDRALARSGYDLTMLAMPGGARRLANVRKLMRLGREYEAVAGRDLRGFLELAAGRAAGWAGYGDAVRESEAPVEGEALDAVRLMTIHRAKGLEFPIVCVADIGRQPWRRGELLRLGRDGRFGLRLAEPGSTRAVPALDYDAIGEQQLAAQEREERRLFYVAMTRARERLIVSGAAKLEEWPALTGATPIAWIAPALLAAGVEPHFARAGVDAGGGGGAVTPRALLATEPAPRPEPPPAPEQAPAAAAPRPAPLSYSSLGEYSRCGYRFYTERVLGIPPAREAGSRTPGAGGDRAGADRLGAAERGIVVHALLERLDFRLARAPAATEVLTAGLGLGVSAEEAHEIATLIGRFTASEMCVRLGAARDLRREERFSFLLPGELLIVGAIDVLAREHGDAVLIVDYKSDRLQGQDPAELVAAQYATQRLIYGLAALRSGARSVEVAHLFLEAVERPVTASYDRGDQPRMERELGELVGGIVRREFAVAPDPHRAICSGCPAEGGLCSWPVELTRRESLDRLF